MKSGSETAKRVGSESGKRRRSLGHSTEGLIEEQHKAAQMLGLAYISKRPTPWKEIKSMGSGKMLCVPEKKAGVDYFGVLRDGRAAYIEVKRHAGGAFPLNRIEENQLAEMREVQRIWHDALRLLVVHWFPTEAMCKRIGIVYGNYVLMVTTFHTVESGVQHGDKSIPMYYFTPIKSRVSYLGYYLGGSDLDFVDKKVSAVLAEDYAASVSSAVKAGAVLSDDLAAKISHTSKTGAVPVDSVASIGSTTDGASK